MRGNKATTVPRPHRANCALNLTEPSCVINTAEWPVMLTVGLPGQVSKNSVKERIVLCCRRASGQCCAASGRRLLSSVVVVADAVILEWVGADRQMMTMIGRSAAAAAVTSVSATSTTSLSQKHRPCISQQQRCIRRSTLKPFDVHCCHTGTARKHPVSDRVKPVNFWHPDTLTQMTA